MKRWFTLLLPCVLGMTVLSGQVSPEDRKYVDYFLRLQAADLFRTKQFLLNSSWCYVSRKQIERVDLHFSYFRSLTWDQARKLIVSIAMELVEKINSDSTMKAKHLLPEPFTIDQLALEIRTDTLCSADDDIVTIQRICLNHGQLTYYSYPASAMFYGRTTTYKESFQQALMLLDLPTEFDSETSTLVVPEKLEQRTIEESQIPKMTPAPEEIQRTVEPADAPLMRQMRTEPQRVDVETENALQEEQPKTNDLVGMVIETISNALALPKEEANVQRWTMVLTAFPASAHKRTKAREIECISLPPCPLNHPRIEKWQASVFPDSPQPILKRIVQVEKSLYQRAMGLLTAAKQKEKSVQTPSELKVVEAPALPPVEPPSPPELLAAPSHSTDEAIAEVEEESEVKVVEAPALPPVEPPSSPELLAAPSHSTDEAIAEVEEESEVKRVEEPVLLPVEQPPSPELPAGEIQEGSSQEEVVPQPEEEKSWWRVAPRIGARLPATDQMPQQSTELAIDGSVNLEPEQKGVLDRFIASLQSFWGHEENGSPQDDLDFEDEDMENSQAEQTKEEESHNL